MASAPPAPGIGEAHLWRLDLAGASPPEAAEVLNASEIERAGRYAFERDRRRFLLARFALRSLLGHYLGVPARSIAFALNAHGKPELDPACALRFNLGHSQDLGLLAIGHGAPIGVDIEVRASPKDSRELARSLFTPEEQRSLDGIPDGELAGPFLACWTRKEAVLKALGTGLSIPPHRVHVGTESSRRRVGLGAGSPAAFVDVESILSVPGAVAALAVAGDFPAITMFDWNRETWRKC